RNVSTVGDDLRGMRILCPRCGRGLAVPAGGVAAPESPVARARRSDDEDRPRPRRSRRSWGDDDEDDRPRREKSSGAALPLLLLAALGLGAFCLLAIVAGFFLAFSRMDEG